MWIDPISRIKQKKAYKKMKTSIVELELTIKNNHIKEFTIETTMCLRGDYPEISNEDLNNVFNNLQNGEYVAIVKITTTYTESNHYLDPIDYDEINEYEIIDILNITE